MRPQCYFIIYNKTDSLNAQRLLTFNWYLLYASVPVFQLKAGDFATGHVACVQL